MEVDEEFIQLKWNTHQLAFFDTLSSLRDKQVYTDVTLSCGDQFYPAHRLVLSACSTFLARTLEVASCKAPVILLYGIDQTTLEQLLMFMYDGQVTISRNELPKLLKAGQWLEVKGLDSAHDRHRATDSPSANKNPDEFDTSSQETWSQLFSSFTDTNIQQENMEREIKFNKQITSKMQEITNDQSSESKLEISEIKTDQENKSHDSISGLNFKIGSLTNPASEEIKNSSLPTQQMEDTDNSNSFKGWMENEAPEKCSLKDIIEKPDAVNETDDLNCSNALDESIKLSKEKNAADVNKRSLRCKHCRKSFKVRKDLAKHLHSHLDQTQNYCFSCHIKFISKKEFSMHMKIHKAERLHSCSMCEFVSHSIYGLKKHIFLQHRTSSDSDVILPEVELIEESKEKSRPLPKAFQNSEKYECSTCYKIFKDETRLQQHRDKGCQRIIRSKEGYHCPICMYVGGRLRSVEDHLARHTGVYRFRCSYCPYKCTRNIVLQEHMSKKHPEFK